MESHTVHMYILELVDSDDTNDVVSKVRLWILLLLCTFFCPRSNRSCPLQMVSCLDDIDGISSFVWIVAFLDEEGKICQAKHGLITSIPLQPGEARHGSPLQPTDGPEAQPS